MIDQLFLISDVLLKGHYPAYTMVTYEINKYKINNTIILRFFLQVPAERTKLPSTGAVKQRDQSDSIAEVDQLCCISVFYQTHQIC